MILDETFLKLSCDKYSISRIPILLTVQKISQILIFFLVLLSKKIAFSLQKEENVSEIVIIAPEKLDDIDIGEIGNLPTYLG